MSDDERTTEQVEADVWIGLEDAQRSLRKACDNGEGSPALREAAEALDEPMKILERERGRRQLRDLAYAQRASGET